jgi:hypothetical protein
MPAIGATPGVHYRGEELLITGPAATADVDVPYPVLTRCHALEQRLQQDRRTLGLELRVNLAQVTPLLLDVLAVNRVPVDDQRVDPQRDVLDKVLPALPQVFLPCSGSTPRQ